MRVITSDSRNCMWSLFKDFSLPITDKTLKRINAWQRKRCFSFFSARSVRWCFKNSHHSSRAQSKLDKRKWSALQLVCNHLFSPLTEGILFNFEEPTLQVSLLLFPIVVVMIFRCQERERVNTWWIQSYIKNSAVLFFFLYCTLVSAWLKLKSYMWEDR